MRTRTIAAVGSDSTGESGSSGTSTTLVSPPTQQAVSRATSTATNTGSTAKKSGAPSGAKQTTSGTTTPAPGGVILGTIPGGCTTPDPFKKLGGVGLCVDGEWLALWKPKGTKK
jgi:hypothetical protein